MTFWIVDSVPKDPCRWEQGVVSPLGPSVDDLIRALASQPGRSPTTPLDVLVDGLPAEQIDLRVPSDIDFKDCWNDTYVNWWTSGPWGGPSSGRGAGEIARLWILDVNGERLVINASFFPETSQKDRVEILRIVHSVQIDAASAG